MNRTTRALLWIPLFAMALAGCITTAEVNRQGGPLEKLLAEQREPMYHCAPAQMARAEAYLTFARHESSQGRPHTADKYLRLANEATRDAYTNSRDRECLGDRDGDGIPDRDDQCPDEQEDFDEFQDTDGCPDRDNDMDGIPDKEDQCPNQRGPVENKGCPIIDTDGDGLPDKEDQCPTEYGPKANFGCPIRDQDKDGIPDKDDQCPTEPGPVENKGCPYKLIEIKDNMIVLKEKIFFAFNKAVIKKESFPLMDEIHKALVDHPSFVVRIEGHTDSKGNAKTNKKLSQKRADAVKQYLVGKGIDPGRMSTVGHGAEKPIDDNRTEAGRAVNRRVEFHIVNK